MAKASLLLSFVLCIVSAVHAADHVVGGTPGWTEILINYTRWAAGEKFVVGDKLIFIYDITHDVVEVDNDGYENCVVPSNTPSYTGGNTTIDLTVPGLRYFICSISDHCSSGGMKLAITVAADGSSPPSPSPSSTPPSDLTPTPSPSSTPPSDIPSSPSPALVPPPSDVPSPSPIPSPSSNAPSDIVPPGPSPSSELPPSDIPPTPVLESPPPPSGGAGSGNLNSLLIAFSVISATLFAFMG